MQNHQQIELSIVVPLLNEAENLALLLDNLADQDDIAFEVILCDGGSVDDTVMTASARAISSPFPLQIIRSAPGRGRQMNAAAASARGPLLLFLHADSRLEHSAALHQATTAFKERLKEGPRVAGRFGLQFRRNDPTRSLAYFYYEAKARLPRPDCIRGDQVFMITRAFFDTLQGFDEGLPFLEDIRFASAVAQHGNWMLLPVEISTSARRFEKEGLYERQVVNAIIVNAQVTGWSDFFSLLPLLYRCHTDTGRLLLYPLLEGIHRLLGRQSLGWRFKFWCATGRHVVGNTWQLFFWLDAWRCFRSGKLSSQVEPRHMVWFQHRLEPLILDRLFLHITVAAAIWLWYRIVLGRGR